MLTGKDVAEILKVHPRHIARMTDNGDIPFTILGGRRRYAPGKIVETIAKLRVPQSSAVLEQIWNGSKDDWMKPNAAALFVGVDRRSLIRWASRGEVPHYRLGRNTFRFRKSELECMKHK